MPECCGPCEQPADVLVRFSQGTKRTYCKHHLENLQASEFLQFEVVRRL